MTSSAKLVIAPGVPALLLSALAATAVLTPLAIHGLGEIGRTAAPAVRQALRRAPAANLPPIEAAAPFVLRADAKDADSAVGCLADAIYYEAGFEPVDGQRAVAQVVINRVRDRNFPKTICGVVYEGWQKKTGCQFSFACDGSLSRRPPRPAEYAQARAVAEQALNGYVMAEVGTATHYHTTAVKPWWQPTVVRVAQVGSQIFYRWPGRAGLADALDNARCMGREVRVTTAVFREHLAQLTHFRRSTHAARRSGRRHWSIKA